MTHTGERAHISRRRVLQGAAWAAPVVLVATAAPALAASGDNPLQGTTMAPFTHSGSSDYTTITTPLGVTLTGVTLTVAWSPGGGGPSAVPTASGVVWSPSSIATSPAVFTSASTLPAGTAIRLTLNKPQGGSAVSVTLSGHANGGPTLSTIVLAGNVS